MVRKLVLLTLALAACGDPKLKVGLNVGAAGADVGAMAASEIRQSQAAKDRRFEVRVAAQRAVWTGEATAATMRAALDSLADDESVAVVVSRFLDQESLEAARRYITDTVPFISVSPLPPGITTASGPGFSMVPNYAKQAEFLAAQANADDRVAIVHLDIAYGATLSAALVAALKTRGLTPVDVRTYKQEWDEPRMVALGTELERQKDPTLLFFLGRAPSLQLVWQPFRDAAKEIDVIGSDLVESNTLYTNDQGGFTGLKYVRYADPMSQDTRMKDLRDRYIFWIGRGEMTSESVVVYDALMLAGEALRSGARTRAQFSEYFASLGRSRPPFNGVAGPMAFDANGEVQRSFHLAEVTSSGVTAVAGQN